MLDIRRVSSTPGPVTGGDSWRWDLVAVAATMIVVVAINWLHVGAYQTLSPIDELQHVDYLYKAGKGEMVGRGDLIGDEAMHEEACRGIDARGPVLPCLPVGSYHAAQFQEGGQNTAYVHSPVYYFVTAWVGKAVMKAAPIDNLMKTARLLGPMWILPALLLMVPTMRLLGAGVVARTAAAVLAVSFPMVVHATSTVNPDVTSLLGGALVLCTPLLLGERWGRMSGRVTDGLAAAASMALKPSNVVVLIAGLWLRGDLVVGATLAADGESDDVDRTDDVTHREPSLDAVGTGDATLSTTQPRGRRRRAVVAVLASVVPLLIGAAVVSVAMLVVQGRLAHKDPDDIVMLYRFAVKAFPWESFSQSFLSTGFFSAAGDGSNYLAPFLRLPFIVVASGIVAVAALAVTVVAALRSDRAAAVARSVLVATVLGGPALIAMNFVLQGIFVSIPTRYYMSLIPGVTIVGAVTVSRWRRGAAVLTGITAVWIGALGFALIAAQ